MILDIGRHWRELDKRNIEIPYFFASVRETSSCWFFFRDGNRNAEKIIIWKIDRGVVIVCVNETKMRLNFCNVTTTFVRK